MDRMQTHVDVDAATHDMDDAIAVVGIAGRFPGAPSVDALWCALLNAEEHVAQLSDADLAAARVSAAMAAAPNYVRAYGKLEDIDLFDAEFFSYSGRQAAQLDPQQRIFLECAYAAIESAGWQPSIEPRVAGVFAGTGANRYGETLGELSDANFADAFEAALGCGKDFLASRISYKLNLTGPSVVVQTACSTSLVAVHYACQSLLNYECDVALAGGVSIQVPQGVGYLYSEGGIQSPDGRCRPFDAAGQGAVGGSGAGVAVLMRYRDAVEKGHEVLAIVRGSAVNNDGATRVSYTAPGLQGQARVVGAALAAAGVEPQSISMIEAHGTATRLGDAIELAALKEVFGENTQEAPFCAIGSIKSNLGHLDAAAGIAGLIKAVLCLKHRTLVPSLHFTAPNEALRSPGCPFYVNTKTRPWEARHGVRRAGVSSFGIGGTNAHVVLEEAPVRSRVQSVPREEMFPISARTERALKQKLAELAAHLERHPCLALADVAATLQLGRQEFVHRVCVVAEQREALISQLHAAGARPLNGIDSRVLTAGNVTDTALERLARAWISYGHVDWPRLNSDRAFTRVLLPTYPFERQRHWAEAALGRASRAAYAARNERADWCYLPAWAPLLEPALASRADIQRLPTWLVFADEFGLGRSIASLLGMADVRVVIVEPAYYGFARVHDGLFRMDPTRTEHYAMLLDALGPSAALGVIHLWALNDVEVAELDRGPMSFVRLAQALAAHPVKLVRITAAATDRSGLRQPNSIDSTFAMLAALCKVANREHEHWSCQAIELPAQDGPRRAYSDQLVAYTCATTARPVKISYRHGRAPVAEAYHRVALPASNRTMIRRNGTYLITGGLGKIGLSLAEWLQREYEATVVLLSPRGLAHAGDSNVEDARLRERVAQMQAHGGKVIVVAGDVSSTAQLRRCVSEAEQLGGVLNGVFHLAAAISHPSAGRTLVDLKAEDLLAQLQPKLLGFAALEEVLSESDLDFCITFSSNAAILGGIGFSAYAAACAAVDHAAQVRFELGRPCWISVNWDGLRAAGCEGAAHDPYALSCAEWTDIMPKILASSTVPQIVVSASDLEPRLKAWAYAVALPAVEQSAAATSSPRIDTVSSAAEQAAEPALSELELGITEIWSSILDIEHIGLDDDFFDLGGDSLVALKMMARLRELTGVSLPIDALFRSPTIAGLIEEIDAKLLRMQQASLASAASA